MTDTAKIAAASAGEAPKEPPAQYGDMTIREARSDEDYHKAYPVIRQLIPNLDMQTYAHRVFVARATGYRMFVGEVEDEVVAAIGTVPNHTIHDGFVTYIEHIVVDKKSRGRGYGRQMLAFAEARALEEGCHLLELDVDLELNEAQKLYERNGYIFCGKYYYKYIGQDEY